jgi:hypothetical protein
MSSQPVTAKGVNITISFDGRVLSVDRQTMTRKVQKRVPIKSVTAVRWAEPRPMRPGHLTLMLLGDDEEIEATFVKKSTNEWAALRDAVEASIFES